MKTIEIAGRTIGAGAAPYVIAEMSNNHLQSPERAAALIVAAKKAGADAVKLQTFDADSLTIDSEAPDFWIHGGLWGGQTLYQLYRDIGIDREHQRRLFKLGRELGITIFSSPFDESAVDFLEELDAPAYKIASFELVDLELIAKAASTGKPVIMSTGMATLEEIVEAVRCAYDSGTRDVALLHCVSGYPTPAEDANISSIGELAKRFDVPVGFSDHTLGIATAIAAVAFGASIIEKHFTLRRSDGGPDAAFSLEPEELAALVEGCRQSWLSIGAPTFERKASEQQNALFRRSIYVVKDVDEDHELTRDNIRCIRPGRGMAPRELPQVLGRRAKHGIRRGTPLTWELIK
jgi:pseudaminic acid synthase